MSGNPLAPKGGIKHGTYIEDPKCKVCGCDVSHEWLAGDYSLIVCEKPKCLQAIEKAKPETGMHEFLKDIIENCKDLTVSYAVQRDTLLKVFENDYNPEKGETPQSELKKWIEYAFHVHNISCHYDEMVYPRLYIFFTRDPKISTMKELING